ncbi:MAG: efflux RND transporter periplasmic adaptor subunit [Tannerellaceae bacterium]|jgi:Cu(I)/Ag(I) efflux system membrane fusion protein|nr:efflux RND transporter periplasmic adaptor subunit [Tannerellaceae bacterium]
MKTFQHLRKAFLFISAGLVLGILAGWWLFRRPSEASETSAEAPRTEQEAQQWTCSMHPQIRQDKPGVCPICAMELVPVQTADALHGTAADGSITLSEEAAALADVRTEKAVRRLPVKELRLYGTVQPDERLVRSLTAHAAGRIEELHVRFTGETIRRGQTVATLYSPELLNAQQELLEAAKMQAGQPEILLEAARQKLRLLKLADSQIQAIEQSGQTSPLIDVVAGMEGTVTARKVSQGDYVNQGSVLFELTDLGAVWILFDAYEADLPYLKPGDAVTFTLPALPGNARRGRIAFIDPSIDPITRTAKVRVETPNPGLQLKPGMYARALVEAPLGRQDGSLTIPKTAVLWTGKRSIVYVKQPGAGTPVFTLREVELGTSLGDAFVILSGLEEGEEVVSSGAFAIDAGAQLEGKPSMMNRDDTEAAHATLAVQGLCEMCRERIEQTALKLRGVTSASWDIETKQLHLRYDPRQTSPDAAAQAIAHAGHDTGIHRAPDAAYNALPDCCRYREKTGQQ